MRKRNKLVCGVGINDADYSVQARVNGVQTRCPFYVRWKGMLSRCYSVKELEKYPTYRGCTVCEEWHLFSNFKAWMEKQDWEGKHLDKDLLVRNNKVYCPERCIFITNALNNFLLEKNACRGTHALGVHLNKNRNKFYASCSNPFTRTVEHLGSFDTEEQAHYAWLAQKLKLARDLAELEPNTKIANAIIDRYTNYNKGGNHAKV